MERMITPRRALAGAGLLLAALLLGTCANPIDLLGILETEVKIGTGKYLTVESVTPAANASAVNPGDPIVITFDRAVDPTTISDSTILLSPAVPWEPDLDLLAATNSLHLEPTPYLAGPQTYTVTITKGVRGLDGSDLQDPYPWSFTTQSWPAGSVRIDTDGNSGTVENYLLSSGNVTLILDRNSVDVTGVRIATTADAARVAPLDSFAVSKPNIPLEAGEGVRYIYVVFVQGSNESDPESDTIVRDLYVPSVNAGLDKVLNITSPTAALDGAASDSGSGLASVTWSKYSGPADSAVTFDPATKEDTTISADKDGTYVLRLTAQDKAGRSTYDSVTVVRDTVAPGTPAVTGPEPSTDRTPTWTWTSGGDGSGNYQYKLDTSSWVALAATSYTPASDLTYGSHTLYVQERDAYDNWSASGSDTVYVSPPISPLWGSTGVSRSTDLNWPDYPMAVGYAVFLWTGKIPPETPSWTGTASLWDRTTLLASNTKYYWYVVAVDSRSRMIYTSDTYSFTTGAF